MLAGKVEKERRCNLYEMAAQSRVYKKLEQARSMPPTALAARSTRMVIIYYGEMAIPSHLPSSSPLLLQQSGPGRW